MAGTTLRISLARAPIGPRSDSAMTALFATSSADSTNAVTSSAAWPGSDTQPP